MDSITKKNGGAEKPLWKNNKKKEKVCAEKKKFQELTNFIISSNLY